VADLATRPFGNWDSKGFQGIPKGFQGSPKGTRQPCAEDCVGIEYSLLFQRCEAMQRPKQTFGSANSANMKIALKCTKYGIIIIAMSM
jgi:hypothetical protein